MIITIVIDGILGHDFFVMYHQQLLHNDVSPSRLWEKYESNIVI